MRDQAIKQSCMIK